MRNPNQSWYAVAEVCLWIRITEVTVERWALRHSG